MKLSKALLLFGLLALSSPANSQVLPGAMAAGASSPVAVQRSFVFPGGIVLHVKNDEMTDARTCTVSTPLRGIHLEFYGRSGASVWTSDVLKLDYSVKPQMRIGDKELFELDTSRHPHPMFVPWQHMADLVNALYSGSAVRVRFVVWPSGEARTLEIQQGDFASAYDRGSQFCGWPKPRVPRAVPSHEPRIFSSDGLIEASFGGESQWTVHYFPGTGSCYIGAPYGKVLIQMERGSNAGPSSHEFGIIRIYRSTGELIRTIEQPERTVVPVRELGAVAAVAGDDGMIELGGELHSLFGLRDAIAFIEKTCGVRMP
jgi:hypothetical protein